MVLLYIYVLAVCYLNDLIVVKNKKVTTPDIFFYLFLNCFNFCRTQISIMNAPCLAQFSLQGSHRSLSPGINLIFEHVSLGTGKVFYFMKLEKKSMEVLILSKANILYAVL